MAKKVPLLVRTSESNQPPVSLSTTADLVRPGAARLTRWSHSSGDRSWRRKYTRGFQETWTICPFQCSCYEMVDRAQDVLDIAYLLILPHRHGCGGIGGLEHRMLLLTLPPSCMFWRPLMLLLMGIGQHSSPVWKCLVRVLLHLRMRELDGAASYLQHAQQRRASDDGHGYECHGVL